MEESKKYDIVQVVTIIGEQFTFNDVTEVTYEDSTERFVVKLGDDVSIFPREAVIAFRTVPKAAIKQVDTETKIIDIFKGETDQ